MIDNNTPLAEIAKAARERGWVCVPKDYAAKFVQLFPQVEKCLETGWWPELSDAGPVK